MPGTVEAGMVHDLPAGIVSQGTTKKQRSAQLILATIPASTADPVRVIGSRLPVHLVNLAAVGVDCRCTCAMK